MIPSQDWDFALRPDVQRIARRAARAVSDQYPNTIEVDDALQEATSILAVKHEEMSRRLARGEGILHRGLYQDLVDLIKTEAKHRRGQVSYEALVEAAGLEAFDLSQVGRRTVRESLEYVEIEAQMERRYDFPVTVSHV